MTGLTLSFAFLTVFIGVAYPYKVPVLIWSNDRALVLPHPLAGHTVSRDNFIHQYLDVLGTDSTLNVVLFIQDKLDLNDITQNANVYNTDEENDALKHIKKIMSSMSVAQLPSVDSPLSAIAELKSHFSVGSVHELQSPYAVASLALNQSSHSLLVVRLPELQAGESPNQKYFQNIDNIVGSVTSQMKKLHTPFVAVYTAAASSDKDMSNKWSGMASKRSGRQLLGTTASPRIGGGLISNVSGMFMLYASNITLAKTDGSSTISLNTNSQYDWSTDSSACGNSSINCTVVISYNSSNYVKLTISAVQTSGSNVGYWYISAMSVDSADTGPNDFNPVFVELTPIGYSYHCYPTTNVSSLNASSTSTYWTIAFQNLQIQAFGMIPGQGFGYYNDCTCFFTIAIWMGIIAGAVMIIILLFGICMLLDIKTMDRFDDPKGKTITVAQAD